MLGVVNPHLTYHYAKHDAKLNNKCRHDTCHRHNNVKLKPCSKERGGATRCGWQWGDSSTLPILEW